MRSYRDYRSRMAMLLASLLSCICVSGCGRVTGGCIRMEDATPTIRVIEPLRLGMTLDQVKDVLSNIRCHGVVIGSGTITDEGGTGILPSGIEVTFALTDTELGGAPRVRFISTSDPRVRVRGLGVGSRFEEVLEKFSNPAFAGDTGYGILVHTVGKCWLAFDPKQGYPLDPASTVSWIELRSDLTHLSD